MKNIYPQNHNFSWSRSTSCTTNFCQFKTKKQDLIFLIWTLESVILDYEILANIWNFPLRFRNVSTYCNVCFHHISLVTCHSVQTYSFAFIFCIWKLVDLIKAGLSGCQSEAGGDMQNVAGYSTSYSCLSIKVQVSGALKM